MQTLMLHPDLSEQLLYQGLAVLKACKHSNACVFHVRCKSGRISEVVEDVVLEYLYDMVFVAKFFCKTGSWLDRITLTGGRLWVWSDGQQPEEPCHIVVCLDKNKGTVCFPEGRVISCPNNGLCFGLVFNNL